MGFFDKIQKGLQKTRNSLSEKISDALSNFRGVDQDLMEELEDALILSDLGASTASRVIGELETRCKKQAVKDVGRVKDILKEILFEMIPENTGLKIETKPSVILVVGVNGVGKTTTIGKIAMALKNEGKHVIFAAADTFRAAASKQLSIWAERTDSDIVSHAEGADPAAVIFDTISAAKARGADVILCDTAGRLHNKQNLMNELSKINRIIDENLPGCDRETLLVLDATTGQNAVVQAEQFNKVAKLTGLVLTKLDGTAKGAVAISAASMLGVPIKFVGVGEGVEDLLQFSPRDFIDAIFE